MLPLDVVQWELTGRQALGRSQGCREEASLRVALQADGEGCTVWEPEVARGGGPVDTWGNMVGTEVDQVENLEGEQSSRTMGRDGGLARGERIWIPSEPKPVVLRRRPGGR